ncbi:MAG: DUF3592 domain-containing protein [Bacilli bacterium]
MNREIIPKNKKISYFILIGLSAIILVLGAINLVKRIEYDAVGIRVTSTITGITSTNDTDQYLIIKYVTEDGRVYRTEIRDYDDTLDIGDSIEIEYLPKNPELFISNPDTSVYYVNSFLILFGLFMGSIYIIKISNYYKEKKRINKLIVNGTQKVAKILCVEENAKKSNFGIKPFKIACIDNLEVTYVSRDIWLKELPRGYVGKNIVIYIDLDNDGNYFVDNTTVS